jgi:DNA-binding transcriptional LysR family regulator
MNTEYLESFVRVVECNSLAEAARRLHLTPGAVAARIRVLEEELGVNLIQRSGPTVKVTEAGLRIYSRALDLMQDERDLKAMAATGSIQGEVQLGVFPSALTTHLPALLEKFCVKHPEISVQVQYDPSDVLCGKVHAGLLDAALVIEPSFTIPKNCDSLTLEEEPLVVIAPLSYEGREAHELLINEPFIRYHRRSPSGKLVDRYLKDHYIHPRQRIEIDSLLSIVALVERGIGVSLVPDSFSISYKERSLIKLSMPDRTPVRNIGIVWNRQSPRLALLMELVEHARQVFCANADERKDF